MNRSETTWTSLLHASHAARLSRAQADQLHRQVVAAGLQPMWFVMVDDPAFPGCHVGRVHTADHCGGVWLPSALVADTLEALVAMMLPGLTRRDKTAIDAPGVAKAADPRGSASASPMAQPSRGQRYRTGGEYISPPAFHRRFRPRAMPSGATSRCHISP